MKKLKRFVLFSLTVFLGGLVLGYGLTIAWNRLSPPKHYLLLPLPHQLPSRPGAVTFRLAMLHDVIHERYTKHGPAFYRERERLAREKLKTLPPDSDEALALYDDIGAGLDRLGNPAAAVPLLRDKLDRQLKKGLTGKQLYTSYANLGTFIVHANMKAALGGDAEAMKRVREGLDLVQKSMDVNPDAHFGREKWQVVIGEYLLRCVTKPEEFTMYDSLTNELRDEVFPRAMYTPKRSYDSIRYFLNTSDNWDHLRPSEIEEIRARITTLHMFSSSSWRERRPAEEVPFDEPMLGIIGMWRQGGGANPYFCLAIAETMFRVNQKHIAWTAYERASRLADKYGSKPEHAAFLREHCTKRQAQIEKLLGAHVAKELRSRFEEELGFGERYQKEYQQFEAEKIAAGANIHDEHFFDEFHKDRPAVATSVGDADWFEFPDEQKNMDLRIVRGIACFFAGCGLVAVLCLFVRRK